MSGSRNLLRDTRVSQRALHSLCRDHRAILDRLERDDNNNEKCNHDLDAKEMDTRTARVENVKNSLSQLETALDESAIMLTLADHFQVLEADRSSLRLEMGRVQDENDWLREELEHTQERLRETLLELESLRLEKEEREQKEEMEKALSETVVTVAVSKIPVGAWRVDEEREITRAVLNPESSKSSRSSSPAPSRIPTVGRNRSAAYMKIMDKVEKQNGNTNGQMSKLPINKKAGYMKLSAANRRPSSGSRIPATR